MISGKAGLKIKGDGCTKYKVQGTRDKAQERSKEKETRRKDNRKETKTRSRKKREGKTEVGG